jgi:hypothetical protein
LENYVKIKGGNIMDKMQMRLRMETEREASPWELAYEPKDRLEEVYPWDWKHYNRAFVTAERNDFFKPEWGF